MSGFRRLLAFSAALVLITCVGCERSSDTDEQAENTDASSQNADEQNPSNSGDPSDEVAHAKADDFISETISPTPQIDTLSNDVPSSAVTHVQAQSSDQSDLALLNTDSSETIVTNNDQQAGENLDQGGTVATELAPVEVMQSNSDVEATEVESAPPASPAEDNEPADAPEQPEASEPSETTPLLETEDRKAVSQPQPAIEVSSEEPKQENETPSASTVETPVDNVAAELEASNEGPKATINAFTDSIALAVAIPKENGFKARFEIILPAVGNAFDLRFIARATVGRTAWSEWNDDQKQNYIDLLHRYQAAVLASRFVSGAKPVFVIDQVIDAPKHTKIVKTRIVRTDREDVSIDYRMVDREGRWLVADIYLDSKISEVALRRSEYSAIVQSGGYEALIEAITNQIAQIEVDSDAADLDEQI